MNSQQAINLLNGLEQRLDDYCELNNEGKAAFRMAITALELFGNSEPLPSAQPTADVRSNVRGEWRLMTNEEVVKSDSFGFLWANDTIMNYECTKCGYHVRNDVFVSVENRSNFCPNCGADMRGEKDE